MAEQAGSMVKPDRLPELGPGLTVLLCSSLHTPAASRLVKIFALRELEDTNHTVAYLFSDPFAVEWADPYRRSGRLHLVDATHHTLSSYAEQAARAKARRMAQDPSFSNYYLVSHGQDVGEVLTMIQTLRETKLERGVLWVWNTPSHLVCLGVEEKEVVSGLARLRSHLLSWGDACLTVAVQDVHTPRTLAQLQLLSHTVFSLQAGRPREEAEGGIREGDNQLGGYSLCILKKTEEDETP